MIEEEYSLSSDVASIGRTLWSKLVVGEGDTSPPLDVRDPKYKRITPEGELNGFCEFKYGEVTVRVTKPNTVTFKAGNKVDLVSVRRELSELCRNMGIPLAR